MSVPSAETYGLEQIILHHSFKKLSGRTVSIPCHGRTNLAGENGAGKTSVLALIPAFYGEEPERIVIKTNDSDSFIEYYLPTLQSMVIFEFRRQDGLCCAAMYRHADSRISYRFVKGSAAATFFDPATRNALAAGATAMETFNAIEDQGFRVSRQIRTILDYRAILQRDQKLIRRRASEHKTLRAEALEFGLGSGTTRMSHIEKLTHVVLNKHRLMSAFKSMICQTMFQDLHLHSKPTAMNGEALVLDIKSLQAFSNEAPRIRECLLKDGERKALLSRSQATVANLKASAELAREEASDAFQEAEKLMQRATDDEDAFRLQRQQRNQDIDRTKGQLGNRNDTLNRLYTERDDFDTQQLPEKKQAFDNLPALRQQHADARDDYEALTSRIDAFRGEHEAGLQMLKHDYDRAAAARQANLVKANTHRQVAEQSFQNDLKTLDHETKHAVLMLQQARTHEAQDLYRAITRLETLIENAAPLEAERQQIRLAREQHDGASHELKAAQSEEQDSANKWRLAKGQRDDAQQGFKDAEQQLAHLRGDRDAIMQQLNPSNGSWLHQLRKLDPDWGQRLGKVIDPALLTRTDLAPEFDQPASAEGPLVMGWRLDLERLTTQECAQGEAALQARIDRLDSRIRIAQNEHDQAEKGATKLQGTLRAREQELESLSIQVKGHASTLTRAASNLEQIEARVEAAVTERQTAHQHALTAKQQALLRFEQQTGQDVADLNTAHANRRTDRLGFWADEQQQLDEAIDNLNALIADATTEYRDRKTRKEAVYKQLCEKQGLDPDVIKAADVKQRLLKDTIDGVAQEADAIDRYSRWLNYEWPQVAALSVDIADLDALLRRLTSEHQALEDAHAQDMNVLSAQAKNARTQGKRLRAALDKASDILEKFPCNGPEAAGFPGDLANLTAELQSNYQELDVLKKTVINAFRNAKKVINQYDGTQIANAWAKQQGQRAAAVAAVNFEMSDASELEQVGDLRMLMETDIPQLASTLTENFRTEAGRLSTYFEGLENLSREVRQISATLGKKINTEQQIAAIEDINIILTPRIQEDASWAHLKQFDQGWKDWSALNRRTLPSEDILSAFRLVHDTLQSAQIGADMESLVDMTISMRIDDRPITIRSDHDFASASSTGLSYLAIMVTFMGMTRYLCPDRETRITWPVDELGTLSPNNIARLAQMLDANNLTLLSACPKLDQGMLRFFDNKLRLADARVIAFAQQDPNSSRRQAMKQRVADTLALSDEEISNVE